MEDKVVKTLFVLTVLSLFAFILFAIVGSTIGAEISIFTAFFLFLLTMLRIAFT